MDTTTHRSASLRLPGASIYYEVRGSGPLLLIIPGGPQDAGVFTELSLRLAPHYTVVAYDPRGNSRSPFDGPPSRLDVDRQADDASALIQSLSQAPAYVFGTSGGAQIGLNLAARHPQQVRALLAHEPPAVMMLEDRNPALAEDQHLYDTYRREGVEAAMALFFSAHGLEGGPPTDEGSADFPFTEEAAETFARVSGNFEYWLAHGMLPLSHYWPDVAALRSGKARVVVGLGEQSVGQSIHAMGIALASKLGIEPVTFPGDHMGFETHTDIFAATLHRIFGAR